MAYSGIAVHVAAGAESRVRLALQLAKDHGATLIGVTRGLLGQRSIACQLSH